MTAAEVAPRSYDAGYVALSYFISLVGSLSTLQLLQLRTSGRGLYNWYLLFGSSVTMGGIGQSPLVVIVSVYLRADDRSQPYGRCILYEPPIPFVHTAYVS